MAIAVSKDEKHCIVVSPKLCLEFNHTPSSDPTNHVALLTISNPPASNDFYAFKFTTNRKNGYITRPSIGILSPGDVQRVSVTLTDKARMAILMEALQQVNNDHCEDDSKPIQCMDKLRIETYRVSLTLASVFSRDKSSAFGKLSVEERTAALKNVWSGLASEGSKMEHRVLHILHKVYNISGGIDISQRRTSRISTLQNQGNRGHEEDHPRRKSADSFHSFNNLEEFLDDPSTVAVMGQHEQQRLQSRSGSISDSRRTRSPASSRGSNIIGTRRSGKEKNSLENSDSNLVGAFSNLRQTASAQNSVDEGGDIRGDRNNPSRRGDGNLNKGFSIRRLFNKNLKEENDIPRKDHVNSDNVHHYTNHKMTKSVPVKPPARGRGRQNESEDVDTGSRSKSSDSIRNFARHFKKSDSRSTEHSDDAPNPRGRPQRSRGSVIGRSKSRTRRSRSSDAIHAFLDSSDGDGPIQHDNHNRPMQPKSSRNIQCESVHPTSINRRTSLTRRDSQERSFRRSAPNDLTLGMGLDQKRYGRANSYDNLEEFAKGLGGESTNNVEQFHANQMGGSHDNLMAMLDHDDGIYQQNRRGSHQPQISRRSPVERPNARGRSNLKASTPADNQFLQQQEQQQVQRGKSLNREESFIAKIFANR
eukprot:CAMPEP_0171417064 /NCGR_PEP_ID=MMETSP0880-20121228/40415_1 /TAXON_ID=67004 /ORGANISM="Thalassiosira weissflogii, Strain CCMP1336" /LENGTH=645 /DNA_ID=CAMNT_0011935321 /DNA_START=33 /DNA_END=1970 /DNA_ORIENTATION=-